MKREKKRCKKLVLLTIVILIGIFNFLEYIWVGKLDIAVMNQEYEKVETMLNQNHIFNISRPASGGFLAMFPEFYNKNALQIACDKSDFQLVELLLKKGANPNRHSPNTEPPIFSILSFYDFDDLELCKLLISYGANMDKKGNDGKNALLKCACMYPFIYDDTGEKYTEYDVGYASGITEIYKLIEANCLNKCPIYKNSGSRNVLQFATLCGNDVLVEYLLTKGIDVNYQDDYGNTALFIYSSGANIDSMRLIIARQLIDAGADIGIINKEGQTAYDYAKDEGFNRLAELIQSYAQ